MEVERKPAGKEDECSSFVNVSETISLKDSGKRKPKHGGLGFAES